MPSDDELMDALKGVLAPSHREPPVDRIAALRAEVERRRAATQAAPEAAAAPAAAIIDLADARQRGARRAIRRGLVGLAAAAAVFLGGFVTSEITRPTTGTTPAGQTKDGVIEFAGRLRAPASGRAVATAVVTKIGIGRVIVLRSETLPILAKGEFYAVWFVGPGDSASSPNRISAGTFHPDVQGRTDVTLTAAVDPAKFPVLEVTAEPVSGDPAPQGDVVLRAEVSQKGS